MLLSILCLVLSLMSVVNSTCTHLQDDGQNTCEKCPNCCQGPKGDVGPMGLKGATGIPAPKRKKSAFTVTKSATQQAELGAVVTFDEIITNINDDFDVATSKFTCSRKGTYVFSFSIGKYSTSPVFVNLLHKGNPIVSAHSRSGWSENFDMSSNTAVLNLEVDDQVWLEFYHKVQTKSNVFAKDIHKTTTFSGYLLYEN